MEKGMISVENLAGYVLYPAATPEEAYAIADIWYPGMLWRMKQRQHSARLFCRRNARRRLDAASVRRITIMWKMSIP